MMSGNTELLYWRKDKSWYKYNENKKMYELTDKATDRAKESFEMWQEFNRKYSRKKKALHTKEQTPWIDYLEIDEETDERTLGSDAPDDVKKAYEEYLKWKQKYIDNGMKIPK